MKKVSHVFLWVLLMLGTVTAQQGDTKRALEPWMTGIIAMVAFLLLVFIAVLVNKAWCNDSSNELKVESGRSHEHIMTKDNAYSTSFDMVRMDDHEKALDNMEQRDNIVTPM